MTVYIIHENDTWIPPFRQAFDELQLPFVEWNLSSSHGYSLAKAPDCDAIYFNRISPSSHTRNHRYSCEITNQLLDYLSLHSCRIINDQRALTLELSKVKQYAELTKDDIRVPQTTFVASATPLTDEKDQEEFLQQLKQTARENFFDPSTNQWKPFISKHNRAGKGLGVHLFSNDQQLEEEFRRLFQTTNVEEFSIDGIYLLQEYIRSPLHVINRAEFIGYQLMYVIEVDTRQGFQLCPSDACRKVKNEEKLIKQSADEIQHGFNIRSEKTFNEREKKVIEQLENFLRQRQIEVAGIEWVDDGENIYVYDVNCNTNYNVAAEKRFFGQMFGTIKLGEYFQKQIKQK